MSVSIPMDEIRRRLEQLAAENDVRILYACESGSRAWGFESADSDYDVRFLYLRRPEWYLAIDLELQRDVLEPPIDDPFDIAGWDLRKALQLYRKSNPPLYEWLFSPIVYDSFTSVADELRSLSETYYNLTSARFHYLSMAKRNFNAYLRGAEVNRKKYLYVLRPVLAVAWIERGLGIVPMEFDQLVDEIVDDAATAAELAELLRLKRAGSEQDSGAPFPSLQRFLESEIARQSDLAAHPLRSLPNGPGRRRCWRLQRPSRLLATQPFPDRHN